MTELKNPRITRRRFNKSLLAAGAGALAAPAFLRGQNLNSKLNIAVIGAGGRGAADTGEVSSENIVALCDVNAKTVDAAGGRFPGAKKFTDFRELFDKAAGDFDAVVIATCEHSHAGATMLALKHDKHVYCEKPLTHDIWEARQIREMAATKPHLATQMGIQIHATENYHRVVELVRAGVVGPIREAHVWVSRTWGWQDPEAAKHTDIVVTTERPKEEEKPPESLNWDLWIGPAPYRPFKSGIFGLPLPHFPASRSITPSGSTAARPGSCRPRISTMPDSSRRRITWATSRIASVRNWSGTQRP
jgi:hypothetical protein